MTFFKEAIYYWLNTETMSIQLQTGQLILSTIILPYWKKGTYYLPETYFEINKIETVQEEKPTEQKEIEPENETPKEKDDWEQKKWKKERNLFHIRKKFF